MKFNKYALRYVKLMKDFVHGKISAEDFEKKYKNKIKLPEDSERILSCKMETKDFKNILKFSNDCLKYLNNNK